MVLYPTGVDRVIDEGSEVTDNNISPAILKANVKLQLLYSLESDEALGASVVIELLVKEFVMVRLSPREGNFFREIHGLLTPSHPVSKRSG